MALTRIKKQQLIEELVALFAKEQREEGDLTWRMSATGEGIYEVKLQGVWFEFDLYHRTWKLLGAKKIYVCDNTPDFLKRAKDFLYLAAHGQVQKWQENAKAFDQPERTAA